MLQFRQSCYYSMICLAKETIFHNLTFKRVELEVVKRQGMRADVCNCLFTIPLIGVRLPDILVPYLQHSEVCKLVPVNTRVACGVHFYGTVLQSHPGTESKTATVVVLRSRGQRRLTHTIWKHWKKFDLSLEQRCCRGQCRLKQVQPLLAYLRAQPATKLAWSKSAECGVKNVFTI